MKNREMKRVTTQIPLTKEPSIRPYIKQAVECGCSVNSILFAIGRLVTPDEAKFLQAQLDKEQAKNINK